MIHIIHYREHLVYRWAFQVQPNKWINVAVIVCSEALVVADEGDLHRSVLLLLGDCNHLGKPKNNQTSKAPNKTVICVWFQSEGPAWELCSLGFFLALVSTLNLAVLWISNAWLVSVWGSFHFNRETAVSPSDFSSPVLAIGFCL